MCLFRGKVEGIRAGKRLLNEIAQICMENTAKHWVVGCCRAISQECRTINWWDLCSVSSREKHSSVPVSGLRKDAIEGHLCFCADIL